MNWNDLVGPLMQMGFTAIGSAFGGPPGGLVASSVGKMVAEALGVEASPQAVQQAVAADPETAKARLALIEATTSAELSSLQARLADVQSARAMQVAAVTNNHWTAAVPAALTIVVFLMLTGGIASIGFGYLREDGIAFGWLTAAGTMVLGYWFGSSRGAKDNADTLRNIATAANVPSPATQVGQALGTAVGNAVRGR